jgi:hypothetical protein
MRISLRGLSFLLLWACLAGCNSGKHFDGPTVNEFSGKLVAHGKPVAFPPGEKVQIGATHQGTAKEWWIPIEPDGTFKIGWMPIGKYTLMLKRGSTAPARQGGGRPAMYPVPTVFEIVDGKTEYTIDLGDGFKP